MITVLDYGINNIRSIEKALQFVGAEVVVSTEVPKKGKLVIPGVGAFAAAMEKLQSNRDSIRGFAANGGEVLGICLGMQLLFDESEEFGSTPGLGLIPGRIKYLPTSTGVKVPHMGWSPTSTLPGRRFAAVGEPQFYYVHSLVAHCDEPQDIAGTATHGVDFTAMVERGNVFGTQFHPEKSGVAGMELLRKFAS